MLNIKTLPELISELMEIDRIAKRRIRHNVNV
jgi:hypothetical protein